MNQRKSKAGMTLMEVMVSLLILTLLVVAMGTCMDTAMSVYGDAMFESGSASLAGIVNTALSDVLRYAQDIRRPEDQDAAGNPVDAGVEFVFTNLEYGVRDVYFQTKADDGSQTGILTLRSLRRGDGSGTILETELVNAGAYPNLEITNFKAAYVEPGEEGKRGGYFHITYTIRNAGDGSKTRDVETIVRLINV